MGFEIEESINMSEMRSYRSVESNSKGLKKNKTRSSLRQQQQLMELVKADPHSVHSSRSTTDRDDTYKNILIDYKYRPRFLKYLK